MIIYMYLLFIWYVGTTIIIVTSDKPFQRGLLTTDSREYRLTRLVKLGCLIPVFGRALGWF